MNERVFSISVLLFLGIFIMLLLFRLVTKIRRNRDVLEKKEGSQVSFVVDTFHELVVKLKEKEKELAALHKKAEERADVFETYNEYILQSVPSGVISLDSALIVTKVNSSAEKILSIRAEDVIGKSYGEVFRDPLRSILESRKVVGREDIQYTTPSGKAIHIGYTVTPLLNTKKETIGQILVFTDLTELKALEAQAELRERLSSLGEMAAGIAHELRNPMGVIAGYTKLLSKKMDPSMAHVVDSVSKEIAVMDRIITDFLSFARPTELNVTVVDVASLLKTCVENVTSGQEGITVNSGISGIPAIYGDEILLRQAFTNLIQNAVESMPHGGELTFGFSSDRISVEITISDTGHGVPDTIKDKIFLPFYTTKDRGTGLGLAIVHKIVVSHRGTITVESSEKGTTFRVRLPIKGTKDEG
ncbi:MAG TPA: ATP-binding protein [Thermodesulfovibrionales bacterium]|nr:ATP-binding protein [Thermodesulfovibrionales bacterium]